MTIVELCPFRTDFLNFESFGSDTIRSRTTTCAVRNPRYYEEIKTPFAVYVPLDAQVAEMHSAV
ncbi:hypothetical protein AWB81_06711 [Caballeronia arationis]|nr:hypothetical protein AWB81_06711 [Caballeronia arationis]